MESRRLRTIVHLMLALPMVPMVGAAAAHAADRSGGDRLIQLAQASPAEIEAKKKAEQNRQRPSQPQQKPMTMPNRQPNAEGARKAVPQRQQQQVAPQKQFGTPGSPKTGQPGSIQKPFVPPAMKQSAPPVVKQTPPPVVKQTTPPAMKRPGVPQGTAKSVNPTPFIPKQNNVVLPKGAPASAATGRPSVPFLPSKAAATKNFTPPMQFNQLQKARQTKVEAGGRRTVIQEGNRTIVKQDNKVFIRHDEAERFRNLNGAKSVRLPNGVSQTFYSRPDGYRVVTETDRNGHLLRRFRRGPDGREHMIIDNRKFWRNAAIGVGVGALIGIVALNLRPPVVSIPRDRYIMDYDRASDDDLYETLIAPPIEPLERVYSLEEVRYSPELRDRVRRIDLDAITFDFGSYTVGPEQFGKLERLGRSINRVLSNNPDSVFMIEGHTDAVGSDEDNLSLSDRRAQSVAQILTEQFGVPPENLVTQGYGEQFLKVPTQEAERVNRRVAVRNITGLVAEKN